MLVLANVVKRFPYDSQVRITCSTGETKALRKLGYSLGEDIHGKLTV